MLSTDTVAVEPAPLNEVVIAAAIAVFVVPAAVAQPVRLYTVPSMETSSVLLPVVSTVALPSVAVIAAAPASPPFRFTVTWLVLEAAPLSENSRVAVPLVLPVSAAASIVV